MGPRAHLSYLTHIHSSSSSSWFYSCCSTYSSCLLFLSFLLLPEVRLRSVSGVQECHLPRGRWRQKRSHSSKLWPSVPPGPELVSSIPPHEPGAAPLVQGDAGGRGRGHRPRWERGTRPSWKRGLLEKERVECRTSGTNGVMIVRP